MAKSKISSELLNLFKENATEEVVEALYERGVKSFLAGLARKLEDSFNEEAVMQVATDLQAFNIRKAGGGGKVAKDVLGKRDLNIINTYYIGLAMEGKLDGDVVEVIKATVATIKGELEEGGVSETYNKIREASGLDPIVVEEEEENNEE
jgi:hypothetical protein